MPITLTGLLHLRQLFTRHLYWRGMLLTARKMAKMNSYGSDGSDFNKKNSLVGKP